jgi:NTP pyrophosphatase (non-canonical NTP hydrolase)
MRPNGTRPMLDPLRDLIASTLGFFARFNVTPTPDDMEKVFLEEVHELIEAVRLGQDREHMAEEAADVIVTVIALCHAAGIDPDHMIRQMYAVIDKNDAKTHDTHAFIDGKIRRLKK